MTRTIRRSRIPLPLAVAGCIAGLASASGCGDQVHQVDTIVVQPLGSGAPANSGGIMVFVALPPITAQDQWYRVRLNGSYLVFELDTGTTYATTPGGGSGVGTLVPAGTYTAELVDATGHVVGTAPPVVVHASTGAFADASAVLFWKRDTEVGAATVDPTTQDSDPNTLEESITSAVDVPIAIDLCHLADGGMTCTNTATLQPGEKRSLVEMLTPDSLTSQDDLFVHPVGADTPMWMRPLTAGQSCEIEALVVTPQVVDPTDPVTGNPGGSTSYVIGTCPPL